MHDDYVYQPPKVEHFGKIAVTHIPTNHNCRIFHVRTPFYDRNVNKVVHWEDSGLELSDIYHIPSLFVLLVEKVPGIVSLFSPKRLEIWVSKSEAFDWSEIQPEILNILQRKQ